MLDDIIYRFQSTLPVKGATAKYRGANVNAVFQSTLPVKGATSLERLSQNPGFISIHAPREGSDINLDGFEV